MDKNVLGLSNFYEDRSPKGRDYSKLALMYQDLYEMLSSYAMSVGNNSIIPMIETYKKIPAFNFDPTPGQYSLMEILSRPDVASKLGSNTVTETASSRADKWKGLGEVKYSISEKVSVLDYLGLYCNIYAYEGAMSTTYKVVDATLLGYDLSRFSKGIDYVLKDNRLYLFNKAAVASPMVKYFTLEDIFVDKMNAERRLGIYVGLEQPENLTRNEYRELVQLIYYVVTMGPTIKNIETAIRSISGLDEAKVLDRFSEDQSRIGYWTDLTRGDRLKDFDFVISLPEMDQHDIDKLKTFIEYIRLIKPSDSDFIFAQATSTYDVLHMTKRDAKTRVNVKGWPLDKIDYSDGRDIDVRTDWVDQIIATEFVSVDSNVKSPLIDIADYDDHLENMPITIRPNNFVVTELVALYNEIRLESHLAPKMITVITRQNYDQIHADGNVDPTVAYVLGDPEQLLVEKLYEKETQNIKTDLLHLDLHDNEGQMNRFTFDQTHADGSYFQYDSFNITFDGEDRLYQYSEEYRDMIVIRLMKNT